RTIDVEASAEYRNRTEQTLLLGIQKVVAPGNHVAQGLLSFWQIARAAREEGQSMVKTRQEQLRGQHVRACSSQLQGERQASEALANLGDLARVLRCEREARIDFGRTLDEQRH